jgi:YLP motif-containing protein 1
LVLRGLPGSGKSHLAKKIKELEVEQGGQPPRVHSIDDYFMTVSPATPGS